MPSSDLLPHDKLLRLCKYDPIRGHFFNRLGVYMGHVNKRGYIKIKLPSCGTFPAAPLAWFYMTGCWPVQQVDHKNRIKHDNRWENLREATPQQNSLNRKIPNKTGFRGVVKRNGTFQAAIYVDGKRQVISTHATAELAARAYDAVAKTHGREHVNFPGEL